MEKHRLLVVPVIPVKSISINIALKVFSTYRMIDAINSPLYQTPKPLYGVSVGIT